jgi:phosphate uptake regulator
MGGKTYIISLPAPWIKKYGIKKGDELNIEEHGGSIVITTPSGITAPKQFEIDITDFEPILPKTLANIYKNGYSEIFIKSSKPEIITKVENYFNKYFIGLEVVKLEKNSCLIKQIALTTPEEFDNILRRTFLSIISLQEKILEGIKTKNRNLLKEAIEQDKLVNNMLALCKSLLNMRNYRYTTYVYCLCEALQNLADEHKLIAEYIITHKVKLTKEIKDYEHSINLFKRFYELYYKYEQQELIDISKQAKSSRDALYGFFNKKIDQRLLHSYVRIFDLIYEMLSFKLSMEL